MGFLDFLRGLIDQDNEQLAYLPIDPTHVDKPTSQESLKAGVHYVRLRLANMFLNKQTQWFSTWYPAVHSVVRFNFGDKSIEVPNVADATRVGMKQTNEGDFIARNFLLTPTVPFNGGVVTLSAGLFALQGQNHLSNFLKTMGNFAALLSVPQLSLALNVAQPLAVGLQELFGAGGGAHLHLSFQNSFSDGELQSGYLAAVRVPVKSLTSNELWVINDQLHRGANLLQAQNNPFESHDYMLFRTELLDKRDDWESLSSIQEPFHEALKALQDQSASNQATQYMRTALLKATLSPDLTDVDKRRVVDHLIEKYNDTKRVLSFSGAVGDDVPTLKQVMRTPMSVNMALGKGKPTVKEVFTAVPA